MGQVCFLLLFYRRVSSVDALARHWQRLGTLRSSDAHVVTVRLTPFVAPGRLNAPTRKTDYRNSRQWQRYWCWPWCDRRDPQNGDNKL